MVQNKENAIKPSMGGWQKGKRDWRLIACALDVLWDLKFSVVEEF